MQALATLVSLPIFTLPHACPTPVVVYKTHGLSGSAPWTSEPNTNRHWEENAANAFCAWAPLTSSALCVQDPSAWHTRSRTTCA